MSRWLRIVVAVSVLQVGWSQQPTVFFAFQLNPQIRTSHKDTKLRWYTDLGEHSKVSLQFYFEPGYGAYISQRLERIPSDADSDLLDEAYVERLGGWRIGKFYVPFGTGWLLHESVLAVRTPTRFAIGSVPMQVAYIFNGKASQQGLNLRVGTERGGVSVGVGRHFAINATSFTPWRLPEDPLDREGYAELYGADYRLDWDEHRIYLEWVFASDSRTRPDAHYWGARWQTEIGVLEPELSAVYQAEARRWTWRASVSTEVDQSVQLRWGLRGHERRFDAFMVALYGRW